MPRTTRHHLIALALTALFVTLPRAVLADLRNTGGTSVRFAATGTMGMRITGVVHRADVSDDGTTITVTVPLADLRTGIDMRDAHMRDYLDVTHHPNAVLRVLRSALTLPTTDGVHGSAPAEMELNGRTHSVQIQYEAAPANGDVHVEGHVRIELPHYGIAVPSYMGVEIHPRVEVTAAFNVHDG